MQSRVFCKTVHSVHNGCESSMKLYELQKYTRFYSTIEIARMLRVDSSTVKRWADSGKLLCCKTVGGHRRFSLKQVRQFVEIYHLEGIVSCDSLANSEGEFPR